MKLKFVLLFYFIFQLLSKEIFAQKNLILVNTKSGKSYLIKASKKVKLGIKGYNKIIKANLVAVNDSGIYLNGKFSSHNTIRKEEHFINLNDIYSFRKISTSHKVFRIVSGIIIFNAAIGLGSYIDDLKNDPQASPAGLIPVGLALGIFAIPFYIHPSDRLLGNEWKLIIQ